MIGLWPSRPVPIICGPGAIGRTRLFPSGRQGLVTALSLLGLSRSGRVALPEWSSACVIAAAGQVASPIPLSDAIQLGRPTAAILIYEQWGWPVDKGSMERAGARLGTRAIILDRVDSLPGPPTHCGLEIFSLSKTLGLSGGGLVRRDGAWLEAEGCEEPQAAINAIAVHPQASTIMKTYFRALHSDVVRFAEEADFERTVAAERTRRLRNLAAVRCRSAGAPWTQAMEKALDAGAAPGLAPLGLGLSEGQLAACAHAAAREIGVKCAVYHFDVARDAVTPEYVRCLAVPLHGHVEEGRLSAIVDLLRRA